jgi:putative molybdopterin biosynthesis protein
MILTPSAGWLARDFAGETAIDARVIPLLLAIRRVGSLAAAARDCGVPYRSAWALIEEAERSIGAPVANLVRGKGATLTPLAERWLAAHQEAAAVLAARVKPIAAGAASAPDRAFEVRIAASHDIALAQLRDRWRAQHRVEVVFHGSAESLDAYRAGSVDVAGFHVAEGRRRDDPLLARLDPARDAVLRFLTRSQGLIVGKGQARRVRSLADVAARRLAIVNRQPGSGTRVLFDRLLAEAGIEGSSLSGYGTEEFTHAAVAATVAAGRADVGFGIEAAARQLGLGFVPLATEHYRFVCLARALHAPAIAAFRALLRDDATRAVVTPLPGYRLDRPGTIAPFASTATRARAARSSRRE